MDHVKMDKVDLDLSHIRVYQIIVVWPVLFSLIFADV